MSLKWSLKKLPIYLFSFQQPKGLKTVICSCSHAKLEIKNAYGRSMHFWSCTMLSKDQGIIEKKYWKDAGIVEYKTNRGTYKRSWSNDTGKKGINYRGQVVEFLPLTNWSFALAFGPLRSLIFWSIDALKSFIFQYQYTVFCKFCRLFYMKRKYFFFIWRAFASFLIVTRGSMFPGCPYKKCTPHSRKHNNVMEIL